MLYFVFALYGPKWGKFAPEIGKSNCEQNSQITRYYGIRKKILATAYRKSGAALTENALLLVTIATVTRETRHVTQNAHSVQYLRKVTTHRGA